MPGTTDTTTYILKYRRPDGSTVTVSENDNGDPFENRQWAALQVLRIFPLEGVPGTIGDAKRFGVLVRDAPLGEDVHHEPSGLTFRTVDSKEW